MTAKITSSVISGVVCAFLSLPFDNVKTKLMKMKLNADGSKPYSGVVDCFAKSAKYEGITALWVGYPTYCFRVCPHAFLVLLI